jgi:tetratricopeptide (TPR) repeat protein
MRKQLLRLIFFHAIIMCCGIETFSQQPPDFREIDSLSWHYYNTADWEKVIQTGKQAHGQGIDYFYLRMRIAYAHFMKQQYRKAIPHYQQALKFNSTDLDALQLLLLSYEYSGRTADAILFSGQGIRELRGDYENKVTRISFFATYHQPVSDEAIKDTERSFSGQLSEPSVNGYQKVPRYLFLPRLALSHRFNNPAFVAHHQLGYLLRNEFSVAVKDGTTYPIDYQRVNQFDYRFSLDITPVSGFTITPAAHVFYVKLPLYLANSYGFGRRAPSGAIANLYEYSYLASLMLRKEFSFFSLGFSGAVGNMNKVEQQQLGAHMKLYPFYNLNLYYMVNAWWQRQESPGQIKENFIHQHLIGFKMFNNLWLEAETTLPEFSNFHNTETSVVYNSPESISSLVSFRGIIPLYNHNIKFYLGAGYFQSTSGFIPDSDPLQRQNIQIYPSINITTGIIWNM